MRIFRNWFNNACSNNVIFQCRNKAFWFPQIIFYVLYWRICLQKRVHGSFWSCYFFYFSYGICHGFCLRLTNFSAGAAFCAPLQNTCVCRARHVFLKVSQMYRLSIHLASLRTSRMEAKGVVVVQLYSWPKDRWLMVFNRTRKVLNTVSNSKNINRGFQIDASEPYNV